MSRAYAEVIGDPIAHSKSPAIHGFWLAKLGIDAEYRRCHVRADELDDYFTRSRGDAQWLGCNVTIPHKERVGRFLHRVDDRAVRIGAVNTVYRGEAGALLGTNTDVCGIRDAIADRDPGGRAVCVIGSGGAARAAFAWLADHECAQIRALARDPAKAVRVAGECGVAAVGFPLVDGAEALAGTEIVMNATQLGMTGQPAMPDTILSALDGMADDGLVFDMVYAPLLTGLLEAARERGLKTADGLTMLIGQAAAAFELLFDRPAPRQHDADLRALLTA